MPEKFISFPVSDLDGNNLPNTLSNALLHGTTSLTGLTNGTARRVFVLQNPSPSFTPTAAGPTFTEIATGSSNTDLADGATQDFTVNLSGVGAGGTLYLAYSVRSGTGGTPAWTLDGVSMPTFTVGSDESRTPNQGDRFQHVGLVRVARSSVGSGASTTLRMTASSGHEAIAWKLIKVDGAGADTDVTNNPTINTSPVNLNLTTAAGGGGIVVMAALDTNPAFSAGATILGAAVAETGTHVTRLAVGTFTGASAGTRTVTGTGTGSLINGLSFSFGA